MKEICKEDLIFLDNTFCINYCLNIQFPKNLVRQNGFRLKSKNCDENHLFINLAKEKKFQLERADTPFFDLKVKVHEVLFNEIEKIDELKNLPKYDNGFYMTIKDKKEEITLNLEKLDKKLNIIKLENLTEEEYKKHKEFFNQFIEEKKESFAKMNKNPIPEKEDLLIFDYLINCDNFTYLISADNHFFQYETEIIQNYNLQIINEYRLDKINVSLNQDCQ